MRTWMKALGTMMVLALVLLAGTSAVLAAGMDTHIYGLVYVDANGNGVWDAGEAGYDGTLNEYWDEDEETWITEYVGTTVNLHAGDPENAIELTTAALSTELQAYQENGQMLCTVQDYLTDDGPDEDEDLDLNQMAMRPRIGSFGLRPAGEAETVWHVSLAVPDGYVATTATLQYVIAVEGESSVVDFGIAPVGAGGAIASADAAVAASEPAAILMPATGEGTLGLAALAILGGSSAMVIGRKLRQE